MMRRWRWSAASPRTSPASHWSRCAVSHAGLASGGRGIASPCSEGNDYEAAIGECSGSAAVRVIGVGRKRSDKNCASHNSEIVRCVASAWNESLPVFRWQRPKSARLPPLLLRSNGDGQARFHSLASIFPMMTDEGTNDLGEDS